MSDFNIQVASNISGVSIHTLRAWEKRYQAVTPKRTETGRRVYSDDDIKKLKALNDLCSLGHSISSIANKEMNELQELLQKHGATHSVEADTAVITSNPALSKETLNHLLMALEGNRLDIISHELYNLRMTISPRELALEVISPLMGMVGKYSEEGRISIVQEHALSSIIKFHLGKFVFRSYEEKRKAGDLYIITTPENEYHEFGILLASLLCTHYGKNFFYLGPNLPAQSLAEAINSLGGNKIILGTSYSTCDTESPYLTNYINDVLSLIPKDVDLCVGGPGFFDTTKFQKKKNFNFFPTLNNLDLYLKNN
ncbi:MerR family transcriptional regulator [Bacteriovorax sp. DB6_IX]|uniref:MerR family transcriptional regulator n=1 Tax=Bacteriovorax sp. DB6_IX TaxID=1353530 RepID=UPI00038A4920|nr:MerR family transcriptional regulator [Bacteriovorax sp. DB6_IX]EQC52800.1 MerR HTH family regulatory protein [Bacteriovorax sp. DB6_IX]